MKLGLAVLPMDVWADVFVYPWIGRQQLAKIVDRFGERKFAAKLQKFLHEMGKQSLRYLEISSEEFCRFQLRKRKILEQRACLTVASNGNRAFDCAMMRSLPKPIIDKCEFPESEMPLNIKSFKRISIRHFDDQILNFLHTIKSLFTNVKLHIYYMTESAKNLQILLAHLLPMLHSIQRISCRNDSLILLERHFPGTLALATELDLYATPAFIPSYLNWLTTPLQFGQHGPRFLSASAEAQTITAIINAVREQFTTAIAASTFVVYLQFGIGRLRHKTNEFTIQNAATKEQLVVRKASSTRLIKQKDICKANYVKILRHPVGDDAKMEEWMKERAYFGKKYRADDADEKVQSKNEEERTIWIDWPGLTIGQISKKAKAMKLTEGKLANLQEDGTGSRLSSTLAKKFKKNSNISSDEEDEAGPSTSTEMSKF